MNRYIIYYISSFDGIACLSFNGSYFPNQESAVRGFKRFNPEDKVICTFKIKRK